MNVNNSETEIKISFRILKEFATDLLAEIENLYKISESAIKKRHETAIIPHAESLVKNLLDRWDSKIQLKTVDGERWGLNLIFQGPSWYYVPAHIWSEIRSFTTIKKSILAIIEKIDNSTTWVEFQNKLYYAIWENIGKNVGISKINLELIRYYSRIRMEFPHLTTDEDIPKREDFFENYEPIYYKKLTFLDIKKRYRSIWKKYIQEVPLPMLSNWNLLPLVLTPPIIEQLKNDQFPLLPIWLVTDLNNKPIFSLNLISSNEAISKRNILYKGITSKISYFWNLNTFKPISGDKSNSYWYWGLESLWDLYKDFEYQNYTLFDTLSKHSEKDHLGKQIYSPNWMIDNNFEKNSFEMSSENLSKIDKLQKDYYSYLKPIINTYNLRYHNRTSNFWDWFFDYSAKNPLDFLFQFRLYLRLMPTFYKGIIWIPVRKLADKKHIQNLIPFIRSWLPRGPLIYFKSGLIVYSYFSPRNSKEKMIQDANEFFSAFGLEIKFFFEQDIKMHPFTLYQLPSSKYFEQSNRDWNLPNRNIIPSEEEFLNISKIIDKEELKIGKKSIEKLDPLMKKI